MDERKVGRLDSILAWPEEVHGLAGGRAVWVLTDPFSLNRVSLDRDEALVVRALQEVHDPAATVGDVVRAARARFGLETTAAAVSAVVDALERLGFYAGMDFPQRFGMQQWGLAARWTATAGEALARVVDYARHEVPHYRETLRDAPAVRGLDDLPALPVLTRDDVRRHLPRLLPEGGTRRLGVTWQSTSGTTGERLQAAHDGGYFERGLMAIAAMNPVIARRVLGHPFALLTTPVCSGTECHMVMDLPYEKRLWGGGHCLYLNSTVDPAGFTEAQLEGMAADLRRLGARSLTVDAAYAVGLARWVKARRPELPRLDAITASFEVPSLVHEAELAEAFGCPVFEDYSANEVGAIALECPMGTMHVPADTTIVELLDREKRPVGPGQLGRIHLTTLRKSAMPLIRYETADLGLALEGPCWCGSPHPGFKAVEGRISELILAPDGAPVTPRAVDRAVAKAARGVGWYTVAQTGPATYRASVLPHGTFGGAEARDLEGALAALLGAGAEVAVSTVRELRPSASGKFRLSFQERPVGAPGGLF